MKKRFLKISAAGLAVCMLFIFSSCGKAPAETEAEHEHKEISESGDAPSGAIELPLIDPDN